jgi:hypothetical protein
VETALQPLNPQQQVTVDFQLLTSFLILSESLLDDHRLKKSLLNFLNFIILNKTNIYKKDVISILNYWNAPPSEKNNIKKILEQTPLGNPAWGFFSKPFSPPDQSLLDALTNRIISNKDIKSLKSLIRDFINENPIYGSAKDQKETLDSWKQSWYISTSPNKIISKLILLQSSALPIEDNNLPIILPDLASIKIALSDMQTAQVILDRPVWDEMVSLYLSKYFTNFLPFTPILQQAFLHSHLNISPPSINNLATLLGEHQGITGTFVSTKTQIRWNTLNLTLGKICIKDRDPSKHDKRFPAPTRTYGDKDSLDNLPPKDYSPELDVGLGVDLGWHLISTSLLEHRWDISAVDIKNSLYLEQISYSPIPNKETSLIFKTEKDLSFLDKFIKNSINELKLLETKLNIKFSLPSNNLLITSKYPEARPMLSSTTSQYRIETTYVKELITSLKKEVKEISSSSSQTKERICCEDNEPKANVDTCQQSGNLSTKTFWEQSFIDTLLNDRASGKPIWASKSFNSFKLNNALKEMNLNSSPSPLCQLFIADSFKEDIQKKATLESLKAKFLNSVASLKDNLTSSEDKVISGKPNKNSIFLSTISHMTDDSLISLIEDKLQAFKDIEKEYLTSEEKLKRQGELDLAFSLLMERKLNISFPFLAGLNIENKSSFKFNYFLGDENSAAIESWHKWKKDKTTLIFDEEMQGYLIPTEKPTSSTQSISSTWIAMSLVWILQHQNKKYPFPLMPIQDAIRKIGHHSIFRYTQLRGDVFQASIYRQIPFLYWLYVLEKPNPFRKHSIDMTTPLFFPSARIRMGSSDIFKDDEVRLTLSNERYTPDGRPLDPLDSDLEKLRITKKETLREDISFSKTSLISYDKFSMESILNNISFNIINRKYSHDLHPNITKDIRLALKEAVDTLLKRFKNKNLIEFSYYISDKSKFTNLNEVKKLYKKTHDNIKIFHLNFTNEFLAKWNILGDEWVSFSVVDDIEEFEGYDKKIKPRYSNSKEAKDKRAKDKAENEAYQEYLNKIPFNVEVEMNYSFG